MSLESRLDALYARLPTVACRGLCHRACGPIAAARAEVARVERVGRRKLAIVEPLTCSLLNTENRCDAYAARPMICRVFGVSEMLPCPEGCEPSRWLTDAETKAFLAAARKIGGPDVFPEAYR